MAASAGGNVLLLDQVVGFGALGIGLPLVVFSGGMLSNTAPVLRIPVSHSANQVSNGVLSVSVVMP